MKTFILGIFLVVITGTAYATPSWYHGPLNNTTSTHTVVLEPVVTYETRVTEQTIENYSNIENYTPDECQGAALTMASGSNQMYWGTDKPQLSIGVGECGGELASSLMFGMKVNKQFMLNGAWGADEDVNAFGINGTFIFK